MTRIETIGDCTLCLGDSLAVLPTIAAASVDSVVCDPPYELGFMGKAWDASGIAYNAGLWREVCRVLKPGGHLLAFGGTRTYHRMTCAIEDAGFEIRDCIQWIYGSGFPKSLDVSKAIDKAAGSLQHEGGDMRYNAGTGTASYRPTIDSRLYQRPAPATDDARQWQGWGTALKPANEPIVVARKPLAGTVAANVLKHGTGAINVDACRVEVETGEELGRKNITGPYTSERTWSTSRTPAQDSTGKVSGRWPSNVIHDGSDEVLQAFAEFGESKSQAGGQVRHAGEPAIANVLNPYANGRSAIFHTDSGTAARFFYCAKASRSERGDDNRHPTVKPLALARYLVRLVTPPGGVVLTPFLGSGTEIVAAVLEGFGGIGIEIDAESFATACRRVGEAVNDQRSQLPLEVA